MGVAGVLLTSLDRALDAAEARRWNDHSHAGTHCVGRDRSAPEGDRNHRALPWIADLGDTRVAAQALDQDRRIALHLRDPDRKGAQAAQGQERLQRTWS